MNYEIYLIKVRNSKNGIKNVGFVMQQVIEVLLSLISD